MKLTVDLPDELMRAVKRRAVEQTRPLKEVVAELLRSGLEQAHSERSSLRGRVNLPLIQCAHEARPGEELTPERVADILLEQDVEAALGAYQGERP